MNACHGNVIFQTCVNSCKVCGIVYKLRHCAPLSTLKTKQQFKISLKSQTNINYLFYEFNVLKINDLRCFSFLFFYDAYQRRAVRACKSCVARLIRIIVQIISY